MARTRLDLRDQRVLRGMDKDLRKVIALADELGWIGTAARGGSILLMPPEGAPDGVTPIHVPKGRQDTTLAKRLTRMVMRGNLAGVAEINGRIGKIVATGEAEPGEVQELFEVTDVMVPAMTEGSAFGVRPMSQLDKAPEVQEAAAKEAVAAIMPTVTDEKPWLAKKTRRRGNQEMYASDSVVERTWSDGTKDYICAVCREEYTAKQPNSVAAHAGYHTRAKEKDRVNTAQTETAAVVEVEYDPQAERVKRLAREIEQALEEHCSGEQSYTHHDLSLVLAGHIIQRRPVRTAEDEDAVPMTDTDVLARIRQMVAGDMIVRQQRLESEVAELTAQAEAARVSAEESEARVERLRTTLATLSELAGGEV